MCHVSHVTLHMDKVVKLVVEDLLSTGPTPASFFLFNFATRKKLGLMKHVKFGIEKKKRFQKKSQEILHKISQNSYTQPLTKLHY